MNDNDLGPKSFEKCNAHRIVIHVMVTLTCFYRTRHRANRQFQILPVQSGYGRQVCPSEVIKFTIRNTKNNGTLVFIRPFTFGQLVSGNEIITLNILNTSPHTSVGCYITNFESGIFSSIMNKHKLIFLANFKLLNLHTVFLLLPFYKVQIIRKCFTYRCYRIVIVRPTTINGLPERDTIAHTRYTG